MSIISYYRDFVCSKFYSLVVSCTAMPPHSPTNAPNGGLAEFIASVCDAEHPPLTGRVWAKCGSESDMIHFSVLPSKSESERIHSGGPRIYFAQSSGFDFVIYIHPLS